MRSPLTETIYKVQGMITYVRENLSTDEFMLFLDLLVPEPEPEAKPAKKARKKSASKSKRASGLGEAIKGSLQRREPTGSNGHEDIDQCLFVINAATGETCNAVKDDPIHDTAYLSSHQFTDTRVPASTEQSAVVSGD